MESWGGRCPLSGLSNPKLLRASHIKRWADSTNEERLSPHNGILLAAHWDAAFDCGLISFADDGRVIVSEQLSQSDRVALRLPELASVRFMPPHIPFLESHRKRYGFRLA
ncbi:HNH endonuclease signature motif containing protein [Hydrogenophaga intermedia]|uniref:HNH endonuclease n=1 Tax=Hydrogenophaga intermedia TaxID=65786 RepID=UPI0012DF9C3C